MIKFNQRLKELREEKNLSLSALSKEINVSSTALYYWETGERIPNAQAVITLANYFGVTTDYLLGISD
jgi:transcriptional regulator with XRE-family HTH domain